MIRRHRQIPEGMQDTPFELKEQKNTIIAELRTLFRQSAYREVETPLLEYLDVFANQVYGLTPERMWKTFDRDGRVLVVRPDNTTPVLRLVASKEKESPLPLRVSYVQDVALFASGAQGKPTQHTQAGVELLGEPSAEADAEVLALAIHALRKTGLRAFQIDIGEVGFFKGLMQGAGLTQDLAEQLRAHVEEKNMLAIELLLGQTGVQRDVSRLIMQLPSLYGGREVLERARTLTGVPECLRSLTRIEAVLCILEDYGLGNYVSVDLGMVHAIDYYTGIIFRGITSHLGSPLLSGGRYDDLSLTFDRALPAVGFALDIMPLLIALLRQGDAPQPFLPDFLVGFAETARIQVLRWIGEQRERGLVVEIAYVRTQDDLLKLAREKKARRWAYMDENGRVQEGGNQA